MKNKDHIIQDLKLDVLSPVEKVGNLYLKRDDLFTPFTFSNANGTKLRQCIYLLLKNYDKIDKGIITCCSVHSPQSVLVSSIGKYLDLPVTIFYGGTREDRFDVLPMPRIARNLGANLEIVTKMGRISVLNKKAKDRIINTQEFFVQHGIDLTNNLDVFFESVSYQVQNLPDELDNLVITCGSGISSTGILYGLKLYNKKVKNITLVGVAPNRVQKVKNNLKLIENAFNIELGEVNFNYIDLFNTKGFEYKKREKGEYCGIQFHPNYEAKTYNWLKNNIDYKNEKTCLWIVGKEILDK